MSWRERDYRTDVDEGAHSPWRSVRRPPNTTLTLMILHGAAFLLMLMLQTQHGADVTRAIALRGLPAHPLAILAHPFSTDRLFSALFVVLVLWSLGGRVERVAGARRLIALYVSGNLVAGVVYFCLARWQPQLATAALDYAAGALAALCAAAWQHLRDEAVRVLGRVTSAAKVYAGCAAIVIGLVVLAEGVGSVAWLAAVGSGGVVGLAVQRAADQLALRPRSARAAPRPSPSRDSAAQRPAQVPDIDTILAKISRSGVDSLTPQERKKLEAARQALLRRGD